MGNYWLDVLGKEEKKEFYDLSTPAGREAAGRCAVRYPAACSRNPYPSGYVRSKYPTGSCYMNPDKLRKRDRRLRATWTTEANDDLMSWVDMSGRALTELMTKEIRQEIDRKILTDLRNASKE